MELDGQARAKRGHPGDVLIADAHVRAEGCEGLEAGNRVLAHRMLSPHLLHDLGFRQIPEPVGAEACHGLGQLPGPDEIERTAQRARLLLERVLLGCPHAPLDPLAPRRLR